MPLGIILKLGAQLLYDLVWYFINRREAERRKSKYEKRRASRRELETDTLGFLRRKYGVQSKPERKIAAGKMPDRRKTDRTDRT